MKYKAIVSDFDGTICSHKILDVPQNVRQAITDYIDCGGKFVLCTGRMYLAIKKYALSLGLNDEILCLQGSVCCNLSDDKEVFVFDIPFEKAVALCEFAEENNWTYQFYHDVRMFTKTKNKYTDLYMDITGVTAYYTQENISKMVKKNNYSAHKVIVMTEPDEAEQKIEKLKAKFPDFDITQSTPLFIEVVDKNSGKGNAVKRLADLMGITTDEIAVFGDETNDLSMLKVAGLACAPENAVDAVKECADYIYPSVHEGGAEEIIRKIINDEI